MGRVQKGPLIICYFSLWITWLFGGFFFQWRGEWNIPAVVKPWRESLLNKPADGGRRLEDATQLVRANSQVVCSAAAEGRGDWSGSTTERFFWGLFFFLTAKLTSVRHFFSLGLGSRGKYVERYTSTCKTCYWKGKIQAESQIHSEGIKGTQTNWWKIPQL